MKDLNPSAWKAQMTKDKDAVLLDVRRAEEWQSGSIKGAINMDIMNWHPFLESANQLDKNKNYYVFCRSGMRSAQAMHLMDQLGFKHVYNLSGGLMNWDEALESPEAIHQH